MGAELRVWARKSLKEVNIYPRVRVVDVDAVDAPAPPYHIPVDRYGYINPLTHSTFPCNQ